MQTEILIQGSPDWLQARCGRFTSSEIWKLKVQPKTIKAREAGVLSATTEGYLMEKLQERLTGEVLGDFTSDSTDWGHENEPLGRERYTYLTGNPVEETGFTQYGDVAGGSPDGLSSFDGMLEIKCPKSQFLKRVFEDPAKNRNYYLQIQMNLLITGREWCDYVVFDPRMPNGMDISIQRIMGDHEVMEDIRKTINWAEKQMEPIKKRFENKIKGQLKLTA